ncbi:uncharacterized protein LOC132334459 [Haemorhous mexicanus]|uniref:uncharacterized protein LOC132334459 n=1 Tax=Haemorhous mexicanus TaxID=30427 RepID=UPI0028BDCF74|nr:uncharacterized protein LOC132334459 [Haemorhous mexicanus]
MRLSAGTRRIVQRQPQSTSAQQPVWARNTDHSTLQSPGCIYEWWFSALYPAVPQQGHRAQLVKALLLRLQHLARSSARTALPAAAPGAPGLLLRAAPSSAPRQPRKAAPSSAPRQPRRAAPSSATAQHSPPRTSPSSGTQLLSVSPWCSPPLLRDTAALCVPVVSPTPPQGYSRPLRPRGVPHPSSGIQPPSVSPWCPPPLLRDTAALSVPVVSPSPPQGYSCSQCPRGVPKPSCHGSHSSALLPWPVLTLPHTFPRPGAALSGTSVITV